MQVDQSGHKKFQKAQSLPHRINLGHSPRIRQILENGFNLIVNFKETQISWQLKQSILHGCQFVDTDKQWQERYAKLKGKLVSHIMFNHIG